jgi:hypothetical protein
MIMNTLLAFGSDPDVTFGRWFYTNAPAAWISAVIATVGFLLVLRSRKKPKRIIVRETKNTTLVTIWPSVRSNIELFYAGRKINNLAQVNVDIFNEGSEVIQRPSLAVVLPVGCNVLAAVLEPEEEGISHEINKNKVTVLLPYLNPVGDHNHVWKLSILADGDTTKLTVSGGGEGWSVQHTTLPSGELLAKWAPALLIGLLGAMVFLFFYERYITIHFGVGAFEISWRALVLGFPGIIPVLLLLIFVSWLARRPSRKSIATRLTKTIRADSAE